MQHVTKHSPEFEAIVDEARTRVREITPDAARERRGARLIDVREDDEWRAGHAEGAEHIGKGVIERDIVQKVPDKNEELILYCGGGYRSVLAADALQKMGYQRVFSMAGGWKAWLAKGYPTQNENR
jgi:rhodanese-related sulfurtransferase